MADATAEEVEAAEGEGGKAAGGKRRLPGKKLILFVVLPVVLLLGGLGGAYMFGAFNSLLGVHQDEEKKEPEKPKVVVFHELPEILVNLATTGRQVSYLKLRVSLELDDPTAIPRLDQLMPRIVDNFQVYLRELRPDDLSGSAGMYRLKEELMYRVNAAVQPTKIKDVLFKEMLVQ